MKRLMVGLVAVGLLVGCTVEEEAKEEPKKEVVSEEPKKEAVPQEQVKKEIPKEQYDVVWGTYDKEWVYSDTWTDEGFKDFNTALEVLENCSKDTEEATEQCVKEYLINN
jgi:hypothetical protein